MPTWGWVALTLGVLLLAVVALAMAGGSRGSRAEEQRDREGGWRP